MIVDRSTIEKVRFGACKQLWLPVTRGPIGERKSCPVRYGAAYHLQPAPFARGEETITISEPPVRISLAAMTEKDAKAQGHATLQTALRSWGAKYGDATPTREAWKIVFLPGDRSEFYEQRQPRLLNRKMGGARDYTRLPEQGVAGEGAALEEDELKPYVEDAEKLLELRRLVRRARRLRLPLEERLLLLEQDARANHVDISAELRVCKQRIERAEALNATYVRSHPV